MRKISFYLLVLVLLVVGGGLAFMLLKDTEGPTITLTPNSERVSSNQNYTLTMTDAGSEVKSVTISVRKNSISSTLLSQEFKPPLKTATVTFNFKDAALRDGTFELEVKATDTSMAGFGKGNSSTKLFPMKYDSIPPQLSVRTAPPYIYKGGTGVIAFTANKEIAGAGVKVKDWYFPAFKQENGEYVCFFAFPYNIDVKDYSPQIVAEDLAGNIRTTRLAHYPLDKKFRKDAIKLKDDLLDMKDPEFMEDVPGTMTPVERFVKMNSEVRKACDAKLVELGRQTASTMLWHGIFMRLPNASAPAGFAEFRSYMYNDKLVDQQTHLGSDLASLHQASVPAANDGVIVFAGRLGIFGNMVLIDHGMNLQTLYAHLSSISVNVGDKVTKGQAIAQTGSTGIAFGDHLHFGVYIAGCPVNPIEWFDPLWIKDKITDRLRNPPATVATPSTVAPSTRPAATHGGASKTKAKPKAYEKPKKKK